MTSNGGDLGKLDKLSSNIIILYSIRSDQCTGEQEIPEVIPIEGIPF